MADVVSKKAKTENVLPMIPDHVIAEILARLPVKSLLRFRCVCKTWYSVISDPQFCNKLHRMQPCVLICEKSKKFSTITIESLLMSKNRASMTNPTPLFLPWEPEPERSAQTQFLGSCNGLVCVDHKSSSPDRSGLILWNPSTRKFRRLPRPGCYQDDCWTYAWFGYDELVNDYKLVWVNCRYPYGATTVTIKLDVFTSKSKTWRRHNPPTDDFIISGIDKYNSTSIGVLSNGAIHWVTNYHPGAEICILALDLATQKFRLLEFPHSPLYINTWVGSLLGGCLCLCSVYMDKDGIGMDLWMMKEYGVETSWTKLVSIPSTFIPGFEFGRFYPILFSKEGKKIVAMFDNVCEQSGDADEDEILKLEIEKGAVVRFETLLCVPRDGNGSNTDHHFQNNAVLHMESLVSLPAD